MILLTLDQIRECIKESKKAGACNSQLRILVELKTVEEFYHHSNAPWWVLWYAKFVLRKRWIEGEIVILKGPYNLQFEYFKLFLRGRWVEFENNLLKQGNLDHIDFYLSRNGPFEWPEYELVLLNRLVQYSLVDNIEIWYTLKRYVFNIKKRKWRILENWLLKYGTPIQFSYYAESILQGPWKELETRIATDIDGSLYYAKYVLNGPFPLGESVLKQNKEIWEWYLEFIKNKE